MFVVFDLDGTIALNAHREHLIRAKDYDAYYAACVNDTPCAPVIHALHAHAKAGHRVEIWSARSAQVRTETITWLQHHIWLDLSDRLTRMRPIGDHRPDVVLKREWLREARANGGAPDLVYDDRDSVVAMWREEGVACFQVAPGPF